MYGPLEEVPIPFSVSGPGSRSDLEKDAAAGSIGETWRGLRAAFRLHSGDAGRVVSRCRLTNLVLRVGASRVWLEVRRGSACGRSTWFSVVRSMWRENGRQTANIERAKACLQWELGGWETGPAASPRGEP